MRGITQQLRLFTKGILMSTRFCASFAILLIYAVDAAQSFAGENESASGFHDLITRIAVARSAIVSFDTNIIGSVSSSRPFEPEEERKIAGFELRIAFSQVDGELHVARREMFTDRLGVKIENDRGWHLLVETPEWQLTRVPPHGVGFSDTVRKKVNISYFDPRVLGLGFCGDLKNSSSIQRVCANLLQWKDRGFVVDSPAKGFVRYRKPGEYYHLIVDTERDYWPVEVLVTSNNEILSKTEVKLVQFQEHWVPATAKVTCPTETVDLVFEWASINRPLPEDALVPSKICQHYGLILPLLR